MPIRNIHHLIQTQFHHILTPFWAGKSIQRHHVVAKDSVMVHHPLALAEEQTFRRLLSDLNFSRTQRIVLVHPAQ